MLNIPSIRITLWVGLSLFLISLQAQEAAPILTKAEAAEITLENNYDIKVAKNNIEIAQFNASKELNGYLPTVDANGGANSSLGGSTQQFSNGNENKVSSAFNWGANASVAANYTLYDKTRKVTVQQLNEITNFTDLQLRQTVENNLLSVFNNYYEVARLTQNTHVLEQTLDLSRQRLLRAKYQFDYGQGIGLDVLNAEVDIQRDSINLLNIKNQLANAKRNLNVAMGREVTTPVEVDTIVTYDASLNLEQLLQDARINNVQVHLINKDLDITNYDFDVINSTKMPIVGLNAGYNYNFSDNAPGSFVEFSTSQGLSAGVNVAWNIYDGGRRKKQREIVQVNMETQIIQKEQILQQVDRDVINAWETYQNALFNLQAEAKNLETNLLNFQRTAEQFKIGQITSVEFRQAQFNLLNAATNYNTAKYAAKVIELLLIQLSGHLLDIDF